MQRRVIGKIGAVRSPVAGLVISWMVPFLVMTRHGDVVEGTGRKCEGQWVMRPFGWWSQGVFPATQVVNSQAHDGGGGGL